MGHEAGLGRRVPRLALDGGGVWGFGRMLWLVIGATAYYERCVRIPILSTLTK